MTQLETSLFIFLDFDRMEQVSAWRATDDVVMGGVSRSRFEQAAPGVGRFTGLVSLENNGGFASVVYRGALPDLSAYEGLALRVRGEGKRYAFNVRSTPMWWGMRLRHEASFGTTPGDWLTVRLPWERFLPKRFGGVIPNAPPPDLRQLASLGFLIADKQAGLFSLEIDWIAAYRGEGTLLV